MALWRLYYHLIWATKKRQPLIIPEDETQLYSYIIGKANTLGSIIHAVGGIENHIHLVASIPPRLFISDFVQNIKGVALIILIISHPHRICLAGNADMAFFQWEANNLSKLLCMCRIRKRIIPMEL